jgi:aerobic-type carbon monoxide dehydrogenase small subunit (CoxS/CutS family)
MATSTVTVTVNGKPVEQYLAAEKSKEVTDFLRNELRGLRRGIRGAR